MDNIIIKKPGTKSIRELKSQDKNKKFNDLKKYPVLQKGDRFIP